MFLADITQTRLLWTVYTETKQQVVDCQAFEDLVKGVNGQLHP